MSLSLLKAYNSDSSDEDDGENDIDAVSTTKNSISEAQSSSKATKNFLCPDSSDSSDEDEPVALDQQDESTYDASNVDGKSYAASYESEPTAIYGPVRPVHPSQMYNYATYEDYSAPTTSIPDPDDSQEPARKRYRGLINDNDAKKLIQKYEADAMNLAMPDELEIVDANVDRHLGDVKSSLIRNITMGPAPNLPSAEEKEKPGALAKRKHQITYLAYLAKANEDKLQNEWAKNRRTKKQTQAKYGF